MAIAKTEFHKMRTPEKIKYTRYLVANMSENDHFQSPDPSLKQLETAALELEQIRELALDGGKRHKANEKVKEKHLTTLISQMRSYVQTVSKGDEAIIRSSGMDIAKRKTPSKTPHAPQSLLAEYGSRKGEINLKWKRVTGARIYLVEITTDKTQTTSWKLAAQSTKSRITLQQLESGKKYWCRVSAVGTAGQSDWSQAVENYAV